jgi:hypothetical protein
MPTVFCREKPLAPLANDFLDSTDYAADTNLTDTAASATRVFSAHRRGEVLNSEHRIAVAILSSLID